MVRVPQESRGRVLVALLAASVTLAPTPVLAAQQPEGVSETALRAAPPAEWLTTGRDYAETHYSPLDQIDADNVEQLGLACSWIIPKEGARLEATPLVSDGVMYATGPKSFVYALDARTGEKKWLWDPGIPDEREGGPSICCGDVNRGVALYGDKVFVGLLDGRLVGLDRETGLVEWTVQTTPRGTDYSVTGAPRVVKGNVIIGNSGAEYGVRGYVTAYDAETGDQAWRSYTVPGNPADGFENEAMRAAAETWTGEWWVGGGGGTVWDGMAFDPEADLLYVGTGNGSPWNRDLRSPGGGDNLYLSSILALNPDTGEPVWHYQTTPGDDWDYTATQPLMLLDLTIAGRDRKVIIQAPKNGVFYVVDRLPGELLSASAYADAGTDVRAAREDRPDRPEAEGPRTMLLALDPVTNTEVWRAVSEGAHGGTMSTAGNLVFRGGGDRLIAHDARTGEELWSATVGQGTATPVTYELDGTQYVPIAAGRRVRRVYTFVLDGLPVR